MKSDSITKKSPKAASQTISIPKIGLGTYKLKGTEGQESIRHALETGYRHIDTAKIYENESEVGQAVRESGIDRDQIFITTKIWPSDFKRLITRTEDSLRRLNTDYVDLLLLHWPSSDDTNKVGADFLNEVLHKGYVKNVGVSNFNIDQLNKTLDLAPIVCNQVEYHPFLSQSKMLDFLQEKDMFLTAYRPLALGTVNENATLVKLSRKHNRTVSQVVLRWLMQQEDVAAIPKSVSARRQKENLNIFDFELDKEEMQLIFDLARNERLTNPETAPKWD